MLKPNFEKADGLGISRHNWSNVMIREHHVVIVHTYWKNKQRYQVTKKLSESKKMSDEEITNKFQNIAWFKLLNIENREST